MAVESIQKVEDWYKNRSYNSDGSLRNVTLSDCANGIITRFGKYRSEMQARVKGYEKLLMLADAEVISPKPDLPNVSSGEASGMVLRMARNLVQNTPNMEVVCEFNSKSPKGIFVDYTLRTKIIGDNLYSNDMQQNLFASTKNALTLGFDCVIPLMTKQTDGTWYVEYNNIFYQDVFPEPGAKDIRSAKNVFIRRYMSKADLKRIVQLKPSGWDIDAVRFLLQETPRNRDLDSVDHQSKKHHTVPTGYEVITYYTNTGEPFLTFSESQGSRVLLRLEQNTHPLKWHPVFFLVLEKDLNQPLGKSQVERIIGRQEFQDLMLNGAMKMWYRNINPPLIGYGTVNAVPNLSPGKFTPISNPNAKVEAFEINTQTLMQFNSISQANAGNMVQQIGAADQQMASQNTGGMMSQTPQGVEAQQAMVDITTNNYQKAIENFFSRYCAYALTLYFHELRGVESVMPSAFTRQALINAGIPEEEFGEDGSLKVSMKDLATEYAVKVTPGSLVEMEDEKQLRILNELFIPLSQAMPALAATEDRAALEHATAAMLFIIQKQLELSGSYHSKDMTDLLTGDKTQEEVHAEDLARKEAENELNALRDEQMNMMIKTLAGVQEQIGVLSQANSELMKRLGIDSNPTASEEPETIP